MNIVFVDIEALGTPPGQEIRSESAEKRGKDTGRNSVSMPAAVFDYGACDLSGARLHTKNASEFAGFLGIGKYDVICGHNLMDFDLQYIQKTVENAGIRETVDTLYLSPLLYPDRISHALPKDDKTGPDDFSNPLNDAVKAMELFQLEVSSYRALPEELKKIYRSLLSQDPHFSSFFHWLSSECPDAPAVTDGGELSLLIKNTFENRICGSCDLSDLAENHPAELAYCLAAIDASDVRPVLPLWVRHSFSAAETVMKRLRDHPCTDPECGYCRAHFDPEKWLRDVFGYSSFRTYEGEPLQENAVRAALRGESLLVLFPTGGGKSLTFQLPAIMQGAAEDGLTVVISPLQALMKDQVDNLEKQGMIGAVTINGMLDPIERSASVEQVMNGSASLLYISPESLRSRTIRHLLESRTVVRFVIDEAHCFSAWGQDFRVDYQYIGEFIAELGREKQLEHPIPVSCFTATAKKKVISDIRSYFRETSGQQLSLYAAASERENLRYEVVYIEEESEKYSFMRELILAKDCPVIVYVSTVSETYRIAEHLQEDKIRAVPYNGRMDRRQKTENQEAFIRNEADVIVATSAFGMGVDKPDIGLVIHYEIAGSLEDYIQEAGRAGRDSSIEADCYILYNDRDLQKHFTMLNQTKLSIGMIQQMWSAVKRLTRRSPYISRSALEFAKEAGWDTSAGLPGEMETRVKAALSALEMAGYIRRGDNMPHVYANSIKVKNVPEAAEKMKDSGLFSKDDTTKSRDLISSLLSSSYTHEMRGDDAESRVDYLADRIGESRGRVISYIYKLRNAGILADDEDLTMYVPDGKTFASAKLRVKKYIRTEEQMLESRLVKTGEVNVKQLNGELHEAGAAESTPQMITKILNFWALRGYIRKRSPGRDTCVFDINENWNQLKEKRRKCMDAAEAIIDYLSDLYKSGGGHEIRFSVMELAERYNIEHIFQASPYEIAEALLYLTRIEALNVDGGFLVIYNSMRVERLEQRNNIRYKKSDYEELDEYYRNRIRQIHIVGRFAKTMAADYDAGLEFVRDYFNMEFRDFIDKYYDESERPMLERGITPEKYRQLAGGLSDIQRQILDDNTSKYIAVIAGPGSGKTKVLVHKLASLVLIEDVKQEQLLMLTFSRSAASEFQNRLRALIGNAAYYIDIRTFHSYALDLIGEVGTLEKLDGVVAEAARMIENNEVEPGRVAKTVVVIDEAQDMDEDAYLLIRALMRRNEAMRVIAVGDDDQNIYEFRGSDSRYLASLITEAGAAKYEMPDDYRSRPAIVALANAFAKTIQHRIKEQPVRSMRRDEAGTVEIIRHVSGNMELPVVEHILEQHADESACILTATNAEAAQITGLLKRRGADAELIQSNDGFDLYDIAEMRFFLGRLAGYGPLVSEEQWADALSDLETVYHRSACLQTCLRILRAFAGAHRSRYRSDLEVFLHESALEDFSGINPEDKEKQGRSRIIVSTIHKAKGREFDSVYMMLNDVRLENDADRRKIYVGMTRARDCLYIHCNNGILDDLMTPAQEVKDGILRKFDGNIYQKPDEIVMQLSHRGVYLDYFKNRERKHFILSHLQSGDQLEISGSGLYARGTGAPAARLSKAAVNDIQKYMSMGYVPDRAVIRFIVSWHAKDEEEEYAVILPDIYMRKLPEAVPAAR